MEWIREIGFDRPWMLLLLVILPAIVALSFNSLAGLGTYRRLAAILFRSIVFTALVFALAEIHWRELTDRVTVLYLLDQSESIPRDQRDAMLTYVKQSVEQHRREGNAPGEGDMAGVIIFGASAKIETAPYEGLLPIVDRIESDFDLKTDATNLESALRLAKAAFPEDTARRIVIVTDGNQNVGDASTIVAALAQDGVGIDVVPVLLDARSDIAVDKLMVPNDIRNGQKFEARVVISNDALGENGQPLENVKGRLLLSQKIDQREEMIAEESVTLSPGKNVIGFTHELDRSAMVNFNARFIADDPLVDSVEKNNEASAFSQVRGEGQVLLIEDVANPGEFTQLVEMLNKAKIRVDVRASDNPFSTAAELLQYDSIILANVSRASEGPTGSTVAFSDEQIRMLVSNCEELGCGLVMLGGDRSFGAGGWSNTELEKAMPVDFQIKNDKVSAVGALVLIMHASEMGNGNFWQVKISQEALNVLGPMDFCGVVDWSDFTAVPRWLWSLPNGLDRVDTNRKRMQAMLNRMTPGDMMDFDPPMRLALAGFKNSTASMKHMIIISDGDPTPPTQGILNQYVAAKVKISTVAVGTHGPAGSNLLRSISQMTGGKYYEVTDPRALPKIFQREARRVAKPVVKESKAGMRVIATGSTGRHEMLQGVEVAELPPFYGYVMTTLKKNALVEQLLVASDPADNPENSTLLATWRYGVGRAVVFTSDAGFIWCNDWYNNPNYQKIFSQIVRYSMRPVTEDANFTVGTDIRDNKVRVVVTAVDPNDDFINFLNLNARGIQPDGQGFDLNFSQSAPGRYEAEFDTNNSGNYLFSISPGEGYERLTSGINVPFATEYADRETNQPLIDNWVALPAKDGTLNGMQASPLTTVSDLEQPLQLNPFRMGLLHAATIQAMWPFMLLLAGWIFLTDVFIRRVAVNLNWVSVAAGWVREKVTGKEQPNLQSNMERLRSKKSEVTRQLERARSDMRFEVPDSDRTTSGTEQLTRVLESERDREIEAPAPKSVQNVETPNADLPHTSRLLDAKRRAQQDRSKKDP